MKIEDFALDLRRCLTPHHHLGVTSGWTVVQPLMPTVCGVADCFSPPLAARGFRLRLDFVANGRRVVDDGNTGKGDCGLLYAGGTWRPVEIVRRGTYHHRPTGQILSFEVESRLTPLHGRAGFLLEVTLRNRSGRALDMVVAPQVEPGCPAVVPLSQWDYGIPGAGAAARQTAADAWGSDAVGVRLFRDHEGLRLGSDAEGRLALAVVLAEAGAGMPANADFDAWRQETVAAWQRRLTAASALPTLESDVPDLAEYYRRSVASALVCLWDRPDFVCRPFVATCGMDGGGICTYPWDTGGYVPRTLNLLIGPGTEGLMAAMRGFGLERHSRFAPDGTGAQVPYSYNTWAFLNLVWNTACLRGPSATDFRAARDTILAIEAGLHRHGVLVDWGVQHNLLEMRQAGYEHIVPSPNAERAWCFDRLADLAEALGEPGAPAWRAEADAIRDAIREQLWNAETGWFDCLYPDGAREQAYSIQIFDALRTGACTPEMTRRILSHVRDGAFLGEYGVSSVSAEDRAHYELNDPDWSGGGAYTGDGPNLAQTLWEQGEPDLAWDVLRRHFWMGKHLPYFPQEHYCDRPAVAAHKRANIVSGIAGAEAIIFGLFGINVGLDGAIRINPSPRPEGEIRLRGLTIRGRRLDISLAPHTLCVHVDGRQSYAGAPKPLVVASNQPKGQSQ